jgi:hypothetical protein
MIDSFAQRAYPEYNFCVPVIRRAHGVIELGDYTLSPSPGFETVQWFIALDGSMCADQASRLGAQQLNLPLALIRNLVDHGFRSGALIDAHHPPSSSRWVNNRGRERMHTDLACVQKHNINYSNALGLSDAAEIIDHRNNTLIDVVGQGPLARAVYRIGLDSGFQFTQQRSLASFVIFVSNSHPHTFDHENSHLCNLPHLHVATRMDNATIGPLVIPDSSSCFRCAHLHRCDTSPDWMQVDLQWRRQTNSGQSDAILTHYTALHALLIIRHWIDGTALTNTLWSAKLPWPRFDPQNAPPHPLCGCQLHGSTPTATT